MATIAGLTWLSFNIPTRRLIRACAAWLAGVSLPLLWCSGALALSANWSISQLHHTAWTPRDGAPTDVQALAQTADGFLWLGTSSGLYRFDGIHFERFQPPKDVGPVPTSVLTLLAPAGGGLWIGYAFGGISFLKDGTFTHYWLSSGFRHAGITTFAQDSTGSIWAGTSRGIMRLEQSRWTDQTDRVLHLPKVKVAWLLIDRAGTLWMSAGGKIYYRPSHRSDPSAILLADNPDDAYSATFSPAQNAKGTEASLGTSGSYRAIPIDALIDNAAERNWWMRASASGAVRLRGGMIDSTGSFWIVLSRMGEVSRIRATPQPGGAGVTLEKFARADGLSSQSGRSVIQDSEGDIWVGTAGGLDRFREPTLVPVKLPTAAEVEMSGAADGGMWLAATRAQDVYPLLLTRDGLTARRFDTPRILGCLYRASDGVVWGSDGRDLWQSRGDRFVRVGTRLPQEWLKSNGCQAILSARDGSLWISMRQVGVFHLEHGVWQAVDVPDAANREPAVALASSSSGQIWMGLVDNRVALVDGKSVEVLTAAQGLDTGTVMAIDAHRGHTWIGGERGLDRFDGRRFRPVLLSDGRAGFAVSGIDELVNGDLWLNTTRGVIWITAEEVARMCRDASYRARYRLFDALEGMPGSPAGLAGLPSLSEGTDGRLWFATSNGIVWLNPTLLAPHNSPMPSVFIEEIASKGQRYPATASVTLPKRTSDLQISYTAPSLSMPERIGFRYRLEGVDHEWREVGNRRVAYYTNLPPGEHRFSVNAANTDGVWSNTIAQEIIIIPATFRQTKAFTALYLFAGAAAIFTVFALRVRQVKRRVRERFELRVAERTRLAQDLHDTLLQTIQACKLAVENTLDRSDMTRATRDNVNRLHRWLDRAAHEGRAALNALRSGEMTALFYPKAMQVGGAPPAQTSTLELTQAIEAAGHALMLTYPAQFRVDFQGVQLNLQEKLYAEVALIVTEALQNAFKHACAREIEVQLYSSRWRLLVRVKDDGKGFDAPDAEGWMYAGHWGIKGMRERSKRTRSQLRISSAPGAGTTVELRILYLAAWIGGVSA